MVRASYLRAAAVAMTLSLSGFCTAHAEAYSYNCRVSGKSYTLTINEARQQLMWRGRAFKIKEEDSCAKFGWRAERPGQTFNFCTATKGYADFEDNGVLVQCDQNQ